MIHNIQWIHTSMGSGWMNSWARVHPMCKACILEIIKGSHESNFVTMEMVHSSSQSFNPNWSGLSIMPDLWIGMVILADLWTANSKMHVFRLIQPLWPPQINSAQKKITLYVHQPWCPILPTNTGTDKKTRHTTTSTTTAASTINYTTTTTSNGKFRGFSSSCRAIFPPNIATNANFHQWCNEEPPQGHLTQEFIPMATTTFEATTKLIKKNNGDPNGKKS